MRCQHWVVVYAGNGGDIQRQGMGRPVGEPAGIVKRGTVNIEVVKQRIGDNHLRQDKAHRREQGSSIAKARMPLPRLLTISQESPPKGAKTGGKNHWIARDGQIEPHGSRDGTGTVLYNITTRYIGRPQLIKNKRLTGRQKDLADLEALEES